MIEVIYDLFSSSVLTERYHRTLGQDIFYYYTSVGSLEALEICIVEGYTANVIFGIFYPCLAIPFPLPTLFFVRRGVYENGETFEEWEVIV